MLVVAAVWLAARVDERSNLVAPEQIYKGVDLRVAVTDAEEFHGWLRIIVEAAGRGNLMLRRLSTLETMYFAVFPPRNINLRNKSAPKGRAGTAQRNALGGWIETSQALKGRINCPGYPALSGLGVESRLFPARCAGLSQLAPSGLSNYQKTSFPEY